MLHLIKNYITFFRNILIFIWNSCRNIMSFKSAIMINLNTSITVSHILDPTPVILRYDLIIGTDDIISYSHARGQWRYMYEC
ncbi:hypothetical protein H8356DRAFT_1353962 [Neocallimastix lanati (nom. inval.)]|nr:hypothetical protein H8356DRAFT_1353962 [Neocallimastix sp. JGI-2020a]